MLKWAVKWMKIVLEHREHDRKTLDDRCLLVTPLLMSLRLSLKGMKRRDALGGGRGGSAKEGGVRAVSMHLVRKNKYFAFHTPSGMRL